MNAAEDYALLLIDTLNGMGARSARDALLSCVKQNSVRVRVSAFKALMNSPDEETRLYAARRAIEDTSSIIRQLALDFVTETKTEECRSWLREKLRHPDFKKFELPEKRRFYRALGAVADGEDVQWLLEKLGQKNPRWSSQIDDERVSAAWTLGLIRAHAAEEDLKRLAGRWFQRGRVRQAAKDALQTLHAPLETTATSPDTAWLHVTRTQTTEAPTQDENTRTQGTAGDGATPLDSAWFVGTTSPLHGREPERARRTSSLPQEVARAHRDSQAPDEQNSPLVSVQTRGRSSGTYIAVNKSADSGRHQVPDTRAQRTTGTGSGNYPTATVTVSNTGSGDHPIRTQRGSAPPRGADVPTAAIPTRGQRPSGSPRSADAPTATVDTPPRIQRGSGPPRAPGESTVTVDDPARANRGSAPPRVPSPSKPPSAEASPARGGEDDLRKAMALARAKRFSTNPDAKAPASGTRPPSNPPKDEEPK
jgi:hypothetical protein